MLANRPVPIIFSKMNFGNGTSDTDDISAISFRSLSSTFSSLPSKSSDVSSQLSPFPVFDNPMHHWDASQSLPLSTAPTSSSNLFSSRILKVYEPVSQKVTPGSEPIGLNNEDFFRNQSLPRSIINTSIRDSNKRRVQDEEPATVERQKRRRKVHDSDPWMLQFENLKAFKRKHGHCNVPQKFPQDPRLGIWVNKQRMEYKKRLEKKKSSITDERVRLLEGVGFVWAKRKGAAAWEARLGELQQYFAQHGDCNVNTKSSLGRWVSIQRQNYKLYLAGDPKSNLTEYKIEQLERLGFIWRLQV